MQSIDRRDFVASLAALFALSVTRAGGGSRRAAGPRLMVTHCRNPESISDWAREGVEMGVAEARRAAAMFGGSVEARFLSVGGPRVPGQLHSSAVVDAVPGAIQVVVVGLLEPSVWRRTVGSAADAGAIVINANARGDDRYVRCERHVFHVRPSPAALASARASMSPEGPGQMELWAPTLTRFGADTLNKRYVAQHRRPMDSSAWGGWFAVKCAWEAATLSRATTANDLISYLEGPRARFDGHKGEALRFGRDHELRQPVYLVSGHEVLGEAAPRPDATAQVSCS